MGRARLGLMSAAPSACLAGRRGKRRGPATEFTAASGWAFSFTYLYDDVSPSHQAVRGVPGGDGVYESFAVLAGRLGYGFEAQRVDDQDAVWAFVRRHIDAGTPILGEHFDGGLICGYRQADETREVWYASTAFTGWVDIAKLNPLEACVLVKEGEGLPREQLYREALRRAVRLASPGADGRGVPSGLEALWAYAADVADPWKGFAQTGGRWFRWAGFERLSARACCAVWLQSAAEVLGRDARQPLLDAAAEYGRAADLYHSFWVALRGLADEGDELARSPEKIATIAPLLEQAVAHEEAGLAAMQEALAALQ